MMPAERYHNVDPVTGLLHILANEYEVTVRGSRYELLGHNWCNTRQLQNPVESDYMPAICGPVSAEVGDGRIVALSAEFPDGSPGLTLRMLDDSVAPERPVSRDAACITSVEIPNSIDDGATSDYVSILKRRFSRQSASIGWAQVTPAVPTTISTTDLELPHSINYTDCVPTVYAPDGWVLKRTDGTAPN